MLTRFVVGASRAIVWAAFLGLSIPAVAHPAPGIVVDSRENVYFVDFTRDRIMKIDPSGKVSVFADSTKDQLFSVPHHLSIDAAGDLVTASDRGGKIVRIAADGKMTLVYPPVDWYGINFIGAGGDPFAIDAAGNIYGTNYRQFRFIQILKIAPDGRLEVLAGGAIGAVDGKRDAARFREPHSMAFAIGPEKALFVSDLTAIRKIDADGLVTTFAGGAEAGDKDGRGPEARFSGLAGINFDARGNLWAADHAASKIRIIAPDGAVTTFPFSKQRPPTSAPDGSYRRDEEIRQTTLHPFGVAVGPSGKVYVLDYPLSDDPRVSRIERDGSVTTLCVVGKNLE